MEEEALGALSATTRLAAAAGLTAAAVQVAASSAQAAQLVPGDGDAISWRNYVAGFQGGRDFIWRVGMWKVFLDLG